MGFHLFHALGPATRIFPTINRPQRFISNRQKIFYTAITLFIYLVCCQIPLYGVFRTKDSDPFYYMRVILASNRGTLMELGLSPIISAGWILQLLVGTKMISANLHTQEDYELFEGVQKLLAIILALGQAFGLIMTSQYGSPEIIGPGNCVLIIVQLVASAYIVILLDQLLQKGYGLGSGISLFIAVNISQAIFWHTLSPITFKSQFGTEFEGSIIAFFHLMITKPSKMSALYQAFYRSSGTNMSNLMATVLVFLIVIYMQGFRIELRLTHRKYSGYMERFPVKLFYTSNMSVILQSALVSNFHIISQSLHQRFRHSWWIGILGTWQETQGQSIPISGFCYWMSPPKDLSAFIMEPLHSLVYTAFMVITCAFFSRFWIEVAKESPRDIAKRFTDQGKKFVGYQQSQTYTVLNKYIPTAAICGGMIIGLISIFADMVGAIGSGTGILLAVSIIYGYYEKLGKEQKGMQKKEEIY